MIAARVSCRRMSCEFVRSAPSRSRRAIAFALSPRFEDASAMQSSRSNDSGDSSKLVGDPARAVDVAREQLHVGADPPRARRPVDGRERGEPRLRELHVAGLDRDLDEGAQRLRVFRRERRELLVHLLRVAGAELVRAQPVRERRELRGLSAGVAARRSRAFGQRAATRVQMAARRLPARRRCDTRGAPATCRRRARAAPRR